MWLQEQQFDHPAHQIALQEMVEAVHLSKERVDFAAVWKDALLKTCRHSERLARYILKPR